MGDFANSTRVTTYDGISPTAMSYDWYIDPGLYQPRSDYWVNVARMTGIGEDWSDGNFSLIQAPTPTPTPTATPTPTPSPTPTLMPTPTPTPTGMPEIAQVDVNDNRLLSIAGSYEFLFSGAPELALSGRFTQDFCGRLVFSGSIREYDNATSISTIGKLKAKKKTGEVCGKLKPVKIPQLAVRVNLRFVVSNDNLILSIKYKRRGVAPRVGVASQPLVCNEHGAQIVVEQMSQVRPNRWRGVGTLHLPDNPGSPVTIKERIKLRRYGSVIRRYRIIGAGKCTANLKLKAFMPSMNADYMELIKARGKISYVKRIDPGSVVIVY